MKKDKKLYLIVKFEEEWKVIRNYSDYAVSNFGRVKRLTHGRKTYPGKILKLSKTDRGYLIVTLCNEINFERKSLLVHALVAKAFLGKKPIGYEHDHLDGNKENNFYLNLEYVTRKENASRASKMGLYNSPKGSMHGRSKINEKIIRKIRNMYRTRKCTHQKIADKFNMSRRHISAILQGKYWKHVG